MAAYFPPPHSLRLFFITASEASGVGTISIGTAECEALSQDPPQEIWHPDAIFPSTPSGKLEPLPP